jgi:hypothetical protein
MAWTCKTKEISKPQRTNWSNQVMEGMIKDLAKNSKDCGKTEETEAISVIKTGIHQKLSSFNYAVHTTNDLI